MKCVKTPILWQECILACIYLSFSLLCLQIFSFEAPLFIKILGPMYGTILFLSGVIHLLERLTQYRIGPESLTVFFLGIRIREIPWPMISHAIYCCTWHDYYILPSNWRTAISRAEQHPVGQMIFITIDHYDHFDPTKQCRWWYRLTHLLSSLCIFLPAKNVTVYTDAFRKYYPKLERQDPLRPLG